MYKKIKENEELTVNFDRFSSKAISGDYVWGKPNGLDYFLENNIFRLAKRSSSSNESQIQFTNIGEVIKYLRMMDIQKKNDS
ncbi:MAG: hypothetical protein L0Y79_06980 [Chlorobi bacterium]|nr:hypothetical protein [Chlorobiota bacterium]MCI0715908.1 hypothetical protein [Chlorobiota bacterium]